MEDNEVLDTVETPTEVVAEVNEKQAQAEKNARALREDRDKERQRADMLEQRLRAYEESSKLKSVEPEEDYTPDYGDEDGYLETKKFKQAHIATSKKQDKIEKKIDEQNQQIKNLFAEMRLTSEVPDLKTIANKENLEKLAEQFPEVYAVLAASPDYYTGAKATATLLKKLGIVVDDKFEKERAAAQANAAKPRPGVAVSSQAGDSPLNMANMFQNGMTPELMAKLREDTERAIRNR